MANLQLIVFSGYVPQRHGHGPKGPYNKDVGKIFPIFDPSLIHVGSLSIVYRLFGPIFDPSLLGTANVFYVG